MGKAAMFAAWMFVIVSIAGNVMAGDVGFVRTQLTEGITDSDNVVTVSSTEGFPSVGIIVIGDERIAYSDLSSTTFEGTLAQPLVRGAESTDAVAHNTGDIAATVQGGMMNTAANYHVAVLADAAGAQAFLTVPVNLLRLFGSFLFLPLEFLGTDLQFLTIVWAVFGIGFLVAFFIALAGGRRV